MCGVMRSNAWRGGGLRRALWSDPLDAGLGDDIETVTGHADCCPLIIDTRS